MGWSLVVEGGGDLPPEGVPGPGDIPGPQGGPGGLLPRETGPSEGEDSGACDIGAGVSGFGVSARPHNPVGPWAFGKSLRSPSAMASGWDRRGWGHGISEVWRLGGHEGVRVHVGVPSPEVDFLVRVGKSLGLCGVEPE